MSGEVQDLTPQLDGTPGGLVSWLLGILCGIIAFLWKLNEGKNSKAILDLDARLLKCDEKHIECETDRHEQAKKLAVMTDRLNNLERKFVHEGDK
jgi:hypothetical protein